MTEKIYPPEVIWIKNNADLLSIYQLEQRLGMAQKTLSGFIREERPLADHWIPKLVAWFNGFVALPAKPVVKTTGSLATTQKKEPSTRCGTKSNAPKNALKSQTEATNNFLEKRRASKLK